MIGDIINNKFTLGSSLSFCAERSENDLCAKIFFSTDKEDMSNTNLKI